MLAKLYLVTTLANACALAVASAGCGDNFAAPPPYPRTVFVIPMENQDGSSIYGNVVDAPYLNSLYSQAARADNFRDVLPLSPSEPHYIWMEAGTNVFADHEFYGSGDPDVTNVTSSREHLVTQLSAAGIPWMSYQDGITTGTCPIKPVNFFAPRHDPSLYFTDIVGFTPSATSPECIAHHKAYTDLADDLDAGAVSGYVFITPDLCHDMHGAAGCPSGLDVAANIKAGDAWLAAELPRILAYAATRDALVLIPFDEGITTDQLAFFALGPHAKAGTVSSVLYTHSSMLKSVEQFLGVPVLPTVADATNLADLFAPGVLP